MGTEKNMLGFSTNACSAGQKLNQLPEPRMKGLLRVFIGSDTLKVIGKP